MKESITAALFLTLLLGVGQTAWSATAPPAKATYVGTEVCKACHAAQFEKFSKTLMGKIFVFNPRDDREKRACES